MIVCKFGGSCTANESALKNIQTIKKETPDRTIYIFSAIGKAFSHDTKMTDLLISLCNTPPQSKAYTGIKSQILSKFKTLLNDTQVDFDIELAFCEAEQTFRQSNDKEFLISRGEYFTALIMAKFLNLNFIPAENLIFLNGQIVDESKTQLNLTEALKENKTFVTCGLNSSQEVVEIFLVHS